MTAPAFQGASAWSLLAIELASALPELVEGLEDPGLASEACERRASRLAGWMVATADIRAIAEIPGSVEALHQAWLRGSRPDEMAWREARLRAVDATDAASSRLERAEGALCEALLWPPTSRGLLLDGLGALTALAMLKASLAGGWTEAQAKAADDILNDLVGTYGSGDTIPTLFAAAAPELEAAFAANLSRENEAAEETRARVAREFARLARTSARV